MSIHQSDPDRKPDHEFVPGELSFLVPGNTCRLLDGRRTPGVIETVDMAAGFFRWRITAFEDQGMDWDVPIEKVVRYQFESSAATCDAERVRELEQLAQRLSQPLVIRADQDVGEQTERRIRVLEGVASQWIDRESQFFKTHESFSIGERTGPEALADDLLAYLAEQCEEFGAIEKKTADTMVLNPNSGEWIKGMLIVMAEAGLVDYTGTVVRSKDLFDGLGARERRLRYLMHRLAFVRAAFRCAGHSHVTVFRGMAAETAWREPARAIVSCTFDPEVASSFASLHSGDRFRTSYLLKLTVPVEDLWMTCCETSALNGRYQEAEAVILNRAAYPFEPSSP